MESAISVAGWRRQAWPAVDALRDPGAPREGIEALGKGLRIIEAFDGSCTRMSATEAAEAAGISRAAARRYLLSLCSFGYAETDGKRFWLAPRVLRLGQGFLEGGRLPRLAQPFLDRLSMASGESANMSVLDGHEVVYVATSRGARGASASHGQGARVPAHVVAAGHAILACRPLETVEAWSAAHEFCVFTPHTVAGAAAFRHQVDHARHNGYAWVEGQHHMGLNGLAVALTDRAGHCVGALALTLQGALHTRAQAVESFLPLLLDARASLRRIL